MNKELNAGASAENDSMPITVRIDDYLRKCGSNAETQEVAELLTEASKRIAELEKALIGLFGTGCIPEHRMWPKRMENSVQIALKALKK